MTVRVSNGSVNGSGGASPSARGAGENGRDGQSAERGAARVLVVDDHRHMREALAETLARAGYAVDRAASADEALRLVEAGRYQVLVSDLRMPGMDGLELLRKVRALDERMQVVLVTAHATVATAVEAIRQGAYDYLEKPFSPDRIERVVAKAVEHGRLVAENRELRTRLCEETAREMIGRSAAMNELRRRIAQIAPTPVTVLIQGESGTGKELVARALHQSSERCDWPFVQVNCAVLSANLLESELFGHEKGAFTGADQPRAGRFELADGGTILLDEVSEISLALQAKLLRVLQEKEFERVGSNVSRKVDVRVLATTNRNLRRAVAQGDFREDLYFRLNVVPIVVPPLRERKEDIPLLVEHFLKRYSRTGHRAGRQSGPAKPPAGAGAPRCEVGSGVPSRRISRRALEVLMDYPWPGNVRQLENVVQRACVLDVGREVLPEHLEPWLEPIEEEPATIPLRADQSLRDMERKLIEATLQKYGGHRVKTATALGIGVRTLSAKLRAYGYPPGASRPAA